MPVFGEGGYVTADEGCSAPSTVRQQLRSSLPLSHGHFSSGDSRIILSLRYFQTSMILFQVNMPRVAVAPLERDAPRTIDVNGVALRLAPERMEVEAGN